MKTISCACGVLMVGVGCCFGQNSPAAGTAAWTNAMRASATTAARQASASMPADEVRPESDALRCEIQAVPGGAVAWSDRMKVEFPEDVMDPIRITLPDGNALSCQARAVVWYNSTTDEVVTLGTVTHSLGAVISANELIYSNAFQDCPGMHLKYSVDASGALSQYVFLESVPDLPQGYDPNHAVIEAWSAWSGTAPVSTESRVIALRDPAVGGEPVDAADQSISFGSATLVGDGKAFSLAEPEDTVPVAKAWRKVEAQAGAAMLIESADWKSLAPKLSKVPKGSHAKASSGPRQSRAKLLASLGGRLDARPNRSVEPPKSSAKAMMVSRAPKLPEQAAVIDFTLVRAISVPSDALAWWPAEDNAADVIGGNDGFWTNRACYGAGKVGKAFAFDERGGYAAVPLTGSLIQCSNELSLEFWMRANEDNSLTTYQGLVSTPFYKVEISNGYESRMGVNFALSTDGGNSFAMTSEAPGNGGGALVSAGAWHHVAATYDGRRMRLYIDGLLWGEALAHAGNISPAPGGAFLTIGACEGTRNFRGRIDELSIYGRALSGTEVSALYAAGTAGKWKGQAGANGLDDHPIGWRSSSEVSSGDTDGDGVPDRIEVLQGRNPLSAGLRTDDGKTVKLRVFTPLR